MHALHILLFLAAAAATSSNLDKTQFEAAFQGKCGHESPCEQLCYELHDGMFECDCRDGFLLHQDGYSCVELNGTLEERAEKEERGELGEDILYQKDASISAEVVLGPAGGAGAAGEETGGSSTQQPPLSSGGAALGAGGGGGAGGGTRSRPPVSPELPCSDCGSGLCLADRCQCPIGKAGPHCRQDVEVEMPRFSGSGWLAFPALKAAYKHVQLELEFRPEVWDSGILFLTGERDDLVGDFMALLIHQGFVEFRFDCGSGVGVVRSQETVVLNQWNRITLYRHRWDAWIQLNNGKHVQGRSKGLFSRMTFREPVFIGGRGNTSGLQDKLPTDRGFRGCVRHLQINDYLYKFSPVPKGDAVKGFDIEECLTDRCSKTPCAHGGKCLSVGGGGGEAATCLCPLGFTGDLCQTRLDLQVPAFNGSSYLRYPGLGASALSWLDIVVVLKPDSKNGLILYNGHRSDGMGDFIALYTNDGHLEFTFDLGTGAATLRSREPVSLGEWHEVSISRTGRLAVLQVDRNPPSQVLSPGAFTQLLLPLSLYIGGLPHFDMVSPKVKVRTSFVGCIQKVMINNRPLQILAEALGGVNVDNCPHPCVTRPCGAVAHCVPHHDAFKCVCDTGCGAQGGGGEGAQGPGRPAAPPPRRVASFLGHTHLHYTDPEVLSRILSNKIGINMRLRTTTPSGLILWTGNMGVSSLETARDYLALGVKDGYLHFRYNLGSGETILVFNETKIDDGNWHRVKASRFEQEGSLSIDNGKVITSKSPGKLKQLNTNSGLFIGGLEEMEKLTHYKYSKGFSGCISELILNLDYHLNLIWSTEGSDHCGDLPS